MLEEEGLGAEVRHQWDEDCMGSRDSKSGEKPKTEEKWIQGEEVASEGLGFGLCTCLLLPLLLPLWLLTT